MPPADIGQLIAHFIVKTILWVVLPGGALLAVYITSKVTDAIDEAREQQALEARRAAELAASTDDDESK